MSQFSSRKEWPYYPNAAVRFGHLAVVVEPVLERCRVRVVYFVFIVWDEGDGDGHGIDGGDAWSDEDRCNVNDSSIFDVTSDCIIIVATFIVIFVIFISNLFLLL